MIMLTEKSPFRLHSPAFAYGAMIPREYTCDGRDVNPPLMIENVPRYTESLVLLVEDPDSPGGTWMHWRVWNISPKTTVIKEDSVPEGAVQGLNTFGQAKYGGPCPHRGEHSYVFRVFALKAPLHLPIEASDLMLRNALIGSVLGEADLVGYYHRP